MQTKSSYPLMTLMEQLTDHDDDEDRIVVKNIIGRIRRLENATVLVDRERAIIEAILESRKQRLGPDHPLVPFPPESYAGCRTIADRINRTRSLLMERAANLRP